MFRKDHDFLAFERVMVQAHQRHPLAILDRCLMPNHWHIVVHRDQDRQKTGDGPAVMFAATDPRS
jgi:putative transposase